MDNEFQRALMKKLNEHEDEIIKIRRYLHAHPETSFHEKNTARYIKEFYRHLDCKLRDCGDGYGILVDIHGPRPGKYILRSDGGEKLPSEL